MKNKILLVLVIAFVGLFFVEKKEIMPTSSGQVVNSVVETLYPTIKEKFNEAELKHMPVIEKDDVVGPNEDPAKCVCKGSGRIVHGDGHVTPCPFHGKKQAEEPKQEVSYKKFNNSDKKIENQVIIFGAEWCAPCKVVKLNVLPELKKLGFKVSENIDADFRTIDIDKNRKLYDSLRGDLNSIPMFIHIKNNTVVSKESLAFTLEQILAKYGEKNE